LRFQVNTERRCAMHDHDTREWGDEPTAADFDRSGERDDITAFRPLGDWQPGSNGSPSKRKGGLAVATRSRKSNRGKRFARKVREYFIASIPPFRPILTHFDPLKDVYSNAIAVRAEAGGASSSGRMITSV